MPRGSQAFLALVEASEAWQLDVHGVCVGPSGVAMSWQLLHVLCSSLIQVPATVLGFGSS